MDQRSEEKTFGENAEGFVRRFHDQIGGGTSFAAAMLMLIRS